MLMKNIESRKMVLMNLFVGKGWRHQYRGQTYGYSQEGEGGTNGENSIDFSLLRDQNWISCIADIFLTI